MELTGQIVDHLRRNLDREYGIGIFELGSSIFAARIPRQHIREFSNADSERIIEYMRARMPRSELDGAAYAYIIADIDYVMVDPAELSDDVYSRDTEKETIKEKTVEDVDTGDIDSVFRSIESAIELEEQKEAEELRRKSTEESEKESEESKDSEEVEECIPDQKIIAEDAGEGIHKILDRFARRKQKKIATGRQTSGRRAEILTQTKRGRYVRYRMPADKPKDIAIAPTIRAAALHADGDEFTIRKSDIREKVRRRRVATLICVVFDASGSMDDLKKTSVTKNVVLELLHDAYQRRDKVSLVTYAGRGAEVVLPFTSSVELAKRYIEHIPFGSTTPLAAGLMLGMEVLQYENKKEPSAIPILALITDGTANMPLEIGGNIEREIANICRLLKQDINVLVIDISEEGADLAENIARACNGRCHHPSHMSQQALYNAIKREQESVIDVKSETA